MILCVLRTPRTIIGLYRDTFPFCRLYTYFSSILNLPHLKGFHRTAVVLQSPWKQCSEWTGWTNPIPNSREGGLGNTPNNPMDSLPDNFELVGWVVRRSDVRPSGCAFDVVVFMNNTQTYIVKDPVIDAGSLYSAAIGFRLFRAILIMNGEFEIFPIGCRFYSGREILMVN